MKLTYSQFEELEVFSSFSARLDEETKKILERGYRIRKILNQPQYSPMDVTEQIGIFMAVLNGMLDVVPVEKMEAAEEIVRAIVREYDDFREGILNQKKLDEDIKKNFFQMAEERLGRELGR